MLQRNSIVAPPKLKPPRKPAPAPARKPTVSAPAMSPTQQATAAVQSQLQPLIDAANARAKANIAAGTQAITGYTNSLTQHLGGINFAQPYQQAESKQAAVGDALKASLAGAGQDVAGGLQARLAAIQEPGAVDPVVAAAAQQGNAAGTTQLAQSGNALGQLFANEAAAKSYGQKLPGIAGLAGLQQVGQFVGGVNANTADEIAKLQAQAPGLENSYLNRLQSASKTAAPKIFGSGTGGYYTLDPATGKVTPLVAGTGAKPAAPHIFGSATGGYWALDPATGKVTSVVKGTGPAAKAPKVFGSASGGYYTIDPTTGAVTPIVAGTGGSSGKPANLQHTTINGHAVTFDPNTGGYYLPGTQTPIDPNQFKKPASVTAGVLKAGRQMAGGFYKGPDGQQISATGIGKLLSQYNKANQTQYSVKDVIDNPAALEALGVTHVTDPQELYVAIARAGVPAQQAFTMVASRNKKWGTAARRRSYFPGKAGAAAEPAAFPTGRRLSSSEQTQLAQTALTMIDPKLATPANVQALVGRIMQESGGNPRAINNWDSNAKAGTPSKGILQTIDPTFASYAVPGHGDIYNPLDNALAAIRYMIARYGYIVGPNGRGY